LPFCFIVEPTVFIELVLSAFGFTAQHLSSLPFPFLTHSTAAKVVFLRAANMSVNEP